MGDNAMTTKVAVYGTLMDGERNWLVGADALDRRPCTIKGALMDTGYGYPAFLPCDDGRAIRAELLTVDNATLARMDILEGYPRLYVKARVTATLDDGTEEQCIVYVMREIPRSAKPIDGDDWRVFRKERCRRIAEIFRKN